MLLAIAGKQKIAIAVGAVADGDQLLQLLLQLRGDVLALGGGQRRIVGLHREIARALQQHSVASAIACSSSCRLALAALPLVTYCWEAESCTLSWLTCAIAAGSSAALCSFLPLAAGSVSWPDPTAAFHLAGGVLLESEC